MPLPAVVAVIATSLVNAIKSTLINADTTDDAGYMVCAKQNKIYLGSQNNQIICVDPFTPAPTAPKTQPAPVVSTPPIVIYRDRIITRDIPGDTVYVPAPVPAPPAIPPRRLADTDPFDTSTTSTTPGKTIKVKYTLDSLSYGTLLHEPLSYDQRRIPIRVDDTFGELFAEKQEVALNNFIRASGGEIDGVPSTEPIKDSINDIAVALIGRNYKDFNSTLSKVTPIVSLEGVAAFINHFVNQNYLNFKPVSTVPYSYEVYDPTPNIVYPNPDQAIQELLEKLEISVPSSSDSVSGENVDISALAQRLGIDAFPIEVPSTLIQESDNNNNFIPIATVQLQSLTELVIWFFQRWEEATGQWEVPIRIKDTDLVQAGDQAKTIKFPNQAEMLAEMFMLLFQANINTETLINMCTRLLYEGGQDKQQNFITYKLLYSLVDWAGYKTKDVADEMPLLFTPNKTKLSEILQETKVKVGTQVLDEKFGLEVDLMRFRKAAAVIDAVHFRKINPFADIAPQIMAYLLGAKNTSDKLNNDSVEDDFENFITQVEEGFKNVTGITDSNLPYGKPYDQRPKIRDLTKIDPPTTP